MVTLISAFSNTVFSIFKLLSYANKKVLLIYVFGIGKADPDIVP